jgi:catechol 2,3-dioxygenase-like lactoylglutathione lyase family enzyme
MAADASGEPLIDALLGATVLVEDPPAAAAALETVLGWERPPANRVNAPPSLTVRSPGTERGMIRLLEGQEGPRSADLREGWSSVELVVRDVDQLAARIDASDDFELRTPPVTFDLTNVGSNVHRAAIAWGPGNLLMAFTMALTQPRGRKFTSTGSDVGPIFSVGLRTADLDTCAGLYRKALHMQVLLEVAWRSGQWHRIWNVPEGEQAALRLLKGAGEGTGLGTIEVQSFPRALLRPPLLPGISRVTYRTRDADAARRAAERVGEVIDADSSSFVMVGSTGEKLEVVESGWL